MNSCFTYIKVKNIQTHFSCQPSLPTLLSSLKIPTKVGGLGNSVFLVYIQRFYVFDMEWQMWKSIRQSIEIKNSLSIDNNRSLIPNVYFQLIGN